MAQDEEHEPGYLVQLAANIGGGRQLTITTNLPRGVSLRRAHEEADKIVAVIGRQQVQVGIAEKQAELQKARDDLSFFEAHLARVDAVNAEDEKSGVSRKMTGAQRATEKSARDNTMTNITTLRERVKQLEAAIAGMQNDFSMTLVDQAAE